MDVLQLQQAIEQALYFIVDKSPDAVENAIKILEMIRDNAGAIWALCTVVHNYPILLEAVEKLLVLLQAGTSIPETAAVLATWAGSLGEIAHALIQLLYWIGGMLLLF